MIYKTPDGTPMAGHLVTVSLRCPACRQLGTFEAVGTGSSYAMDVAAGDVRLGQRRCPNKQCQAHIFIVFDVRVGAGRLITSYPPERIDFDASNVPAAVVAALTEAITCHANGAFTATAMMVRKTLEELCRDRGATGGNLKDRIKALGSKVVLPGELLDGLDDLRLLGNDAAHVESQVYGQIGRDEVEIAIDFTKEVLKAVYQYSALLSRLRSLKKGP